MRLCLSTEMTMFSGLVSRISFRSFGSCTGIDVLTTGVVIRKMISSTSMMSTSGVVLIVEMTASSSPSADPTFIAMASTPDGARLRRAEQHGVQVRAEAAHAVHRRLVAANEPVVSEHRGNRDGKTDGSHDQRLAHRTRNLVDRCLAGNADRGERIDDSPDGPEQSDEGRRRADRREKRESVLRAALDVVDRALDRHRDPVIEVDVADHALVLARRLDAGLGDEAVGAVLPQR